MAIRGHAGNPHCRQVECGAAQHFAFQQQLFDMLALDDFFLQLFIGRIQFAGTFLDTVFQREIQRLQVSGHAVKGTRQRADFIRTCFINTLVKIALGNFICGAREVLQRHDQSPAKIKRSKSAQHGQCQ